MEQLVLLCVLQASWFQPLCQLFLEPALQQQQMLPWKKFQTLGGPQEDCKWASPVTKANHTCYPWRCRTNQLACRRQRRTSCFIGNLWRYLQFCWSAGQLLLQVLQAVAYLFNRSSFASCRQAVTSIWGWIFRYRWLPSFSLLFFNWLDVVKACIPELHHNKSCTFVLQPIW